MTKKRISKKLQEEVKGLIVRDADVVAKMICKAIVDYEVKDVSSSWQRLLKSDIFWGAIQDVLATIPRKK